MSALDIYTLPLQDIQLVEASAGTGKTWTIAGIYLRLLLESERTVDEILVVTFTKAATAELRDRLRTRITEVEKALLAGGSDDPFCQWAVDAFRDDEPAKNNCRPGAPQEYFLRGAGGDPATFSGFSDAVADSDEAPGLRRSLSSRSGDGGDSEGRGFISARDAALQKLESARRTFDEAAIHTIHAFCQRVLGEAQVPALLSEPEVITDEREILPGLLQEAWIRHCADALLADLVEASNITPDVVMQDVQALLRKPYLNLQSDNGVVDDAALRDGLQELKNGWKKDRAAIEEDLLSTDKLSKAKNSPFRDVEALLHTLAGWLGGQGSYESSLQALTPDGFDQYVLKSKGKKLPQHAFWQQLGDWLQQAGSHVERFRRTVLEDVLGSLRDFKERQGLISYQDMLVLLYEAVADESLLREIRQRYSAALIDEFQDTDPLQFHVFDRLYSGTGLPLYLVGDPKQAIYSFRGADIFTYLRARGSASERHSLTTNRRSVPPLVAAVNAVFTLHSNPFLFSDLSYQKVVAVEQEKNLVVADGKAALHCWLLPENEGKYLSKERAADLSVEATANEIATLLNAAAQGKALIGDAPLAPRDIAVLVPKHAYGHLIVAALAARGIAAVQRSEQSVFASGEATDMLMLLDAVAQPGRDGLVKAALLSSLLGIAIEALDAEQSHDALWSARIDSLLLLRERWQQKGFMAMWENLLAEFGILQRVLSASEGERRLTNLRHLAMLMQQQADQEPVPERQLLWLREQITAALNNQKTEDAQLRLESDAGRVQVLTIHVSKGLEYPVVFCPFLWDGSLLQKQEIMRAEYRRGAESVLDIGSPDFDHAYKRMATERLAEKMRVLYVALTRAKYRCYGLWGWVNDSETAPLSWLLGGGDIDADIEAENIAAALKKTDYAACQAALEKLKAAVPEGFSWEPLLEQDAVASAVKNDKPETTVVPAFSRSLQRRWRVSSFTGLSEAAHEHESPDHDVQANARAAAAAVADIVAPEGIHAFPRGAQAGVFWHELLEEILMGRVRDRRVFVSDTMKKYAMDPVWLPVVDKVLMQWLDTPLHSPLDAKGMVLSKLDARVAEMEFVYPVQGLRADAFLSLPDVPPVYQAALKQLDFTTLNGYLKGFMDLVCRHDGRYYVVDYKTNWLGSEAAAYTPERLERAVAESHYYLQYWLYVLALHRHLRVTLGGHYDYERDMGGARYLFLRGIDAATQGVYARKPSFALIDALDGLMRGAA
ncbi:MAG: exodeoxyribonuclease V subunit beta [bacterium]|nr:exodeoxyribonuclease V subunit beta [bacterium]